MFFYFNIHNQVYLICMSPPIQRRFVFNYSLLQYGEDNIIFSLEMEKIEISTSNLT